MGFQRPCLQIVSSLDGSEWNLFSAATKKCTLVWFIIRLFIYIYDDISSVYPDVYLFFSGCSYDKIENNMMQSVSQIESYGGHLCIFYLS